MNWWQSLNVTFTLFHFLAKYRKKRETVNSNNDKKTWWKKDSVKNYTISYNVREWLLLMMHIDPGEQHRISSFINKLCFLKD